MLTVLAGMLLGGCSSLPSFMSQPPQVRGNHIDEDQLSQLVTGTSTRADVSALLGSPTQKAVFDDNTWIYISQVTKPQIAATNRVLDQEVVALSFDQAGVLRGIERKSKDDSQSVSVVERTTPSPGSEASFLQQLLGNVGRFATGSTPQSGSSVNRSGTGEQ